MQHPLARTGPDVVVVARRAKEILSLNKNVFIITSCFSFAFMKIFGDLLPLDSLLPGILFGRVVSCVVDQKAQ